MGRGVGPALPHICQHLLSGCQTWIPKKEGDRLQGGELWSLAMIEHGGVMPSTGPGHSDFKGPFLNKNDIKNCILQLRDIKRNIV